MNFDTLPDVLTVAEVAQFLRLSRKTIYRLIEDAQLAVHRLGRAIRIQKDDLAKFLQSTA